jgi:hypothetical protein
VENKRLPPLTDPTIDEEVGQASPGTYPEGFAVEGAFVPFLLGRSKSDMNGRSHARVGVDGRRTRFGSSAKAAYGSRALRSSSLGGPAPTSGGIAVGATCTRLKFGYPHSAEAAFPTQCERYHEPGGRPGLDNERPLAAPEGATWTCPARVHHYG